jgi:metal-responsive CopG/Arc/MetJ family transcriptional regulator
MPSSRRRFLMDLHVRVPQGLTQAVTEAADKRMTTSSEYIRQAIIERLRQDNLAPRDTRMEA